MSAEPLPVPDVPADISAEIEAAREDLEGLLADVLAAVFQEEVEVLPLDRVAEAILRVLSPVTAVRPDARNRAGVRR